MECREIMQRIEKKYPRDAALDFDNVGLQAGRRDKKVEKILLALDATDVVVEQAVELNADMLITHHPLIFSPLKHVTDEDFIGARILKLLRNDISYYAMHTNYDVLGMADLAGNILGLKNMQVLDETTEDGSVGIGKLGETDSSYTLRSYCEVIKQKLNLDCVRVFGEPDMQIQRVAICPGSGKSTIQSALNKGAQVLVTGDIGHHEGMDATAQGLNIIDAGHYGTEYIFVNDVAIFLKEQLANEVIILKAEENPPFCTI